ncbi:MAG TPA: hypothetical protein VLF39_04130 [Candidatus Saccharimonadales bacterium]|nr:hypothetical protein [Candidatus Saccharimonadales bacterium]
MAEQGPQFTNGIEIRFPGEAVPADLYDEIMPEVEALEHQRELSEIVDAEAFDADESIIIIGKIALTDDVDKSDKVDKRAVVSRPLDEEGVSIRESEALARALRLNAGASSRRRSKQRFGYKRLPRPNY